MYVCTYVCMYVCMYVCVYVCIHTCCLTLHPLPLLCPAQVVCAHVLGIRGVMGGLSDVAQSCVSECDASMHIPSMAALDTLEEFIASEVSQVNPSVPASYAFAAHWMSRTAPHMSNGVCYASSSTPTETNSAARVQRLCCCSSTGSPIEI